MNIQDEIYVVLAEYDSSIKRHQENGTAQPLIIEANIGACSKAHAKVLAKRMRDTGHGETMVGHVSFNDVDQVNPVPTCGDLLLPENQSLDRIINDLGAIFLDGNVRPSLPAMSDATRAHLRLTVLEWVRSL